MLPDKILQSDLLDILFENRNKTYGAYALRRSYNKTIASAISITAFIALTFSRFTSLQSCKTPRLCNAIYYSARPGVCEN
jgi:protein TonB